VDEAVMGGAEQDEVVGGGEAAVGPVVDVVDVNVEAVGAAGKLAAAISGPQGAPERRGNGARSASGVDRVATSAVKHGDRPSVAGDPPERFRGDAGAVIQGGSQRAIRSKRVVVQVDDDLIAVATRTIGFAVGEEALRHLGEGVRSGQDRGVRRGERFRGRVRGRRCGLEARHLDGLHHQRGFIRLQNRGDAHQARGENLVSHEPALVRALAVNDRERPPEPPASPFELPSGGAEGNLQQALLVVRGRHAGHGPDLRVRQDAAPEGVVDPWQGA
jgi:hypothetical protein